MKTIIHFLALSTFLCYLFCFDALSGVSDDKETWPQWRGPQRDGSVNGPAWPNSLEKVERLWQVPLGKGYSGPVVARDRVFVVETVDGETVGVQALSRSTGRKIWQVRWPGKGSVPFFAKSNGDWVRSTPSWDGKTLYVGDMSEVLVALAGETGSEKWRVNFPEQFNTGVPDFGFVCSPLLDDNSLYVQAANSVIKLDKKTGKTIWRSLQDSGEIMSSGAFSSPLITTLAGKRQLVVQTRQSLNGLALQDGKVLWTTTIPNFRGMNILTPAVYGDAIFTSSYRNRSHLIQVSQDAAEFKAEELWTNKANGYMSSPVVIEGHAYLHLGNQRIDCLDLKSGLSKWRSENKFGKYLSMAFQGDKILALNEKGMLYLMRANPERLELIDSRQVVDTESWGHIAISGDIIFIRELEAISVFDWQAESVATSEVQ